MFRVAIGGFGAESNSFSLEKPGDESASVVSGEDLISMNRRSRNVIGGFLDVLDSEGVSAVPASRIFWGATGVIKGSSYDRYRTELVQRIKGVKDLDGVLLDLHGAMLSEDEPDGEGALLREIRETVGESTPIVCVLDLHGNITDLKVRMADALIGYRTNPHVDLYERGRKAALIMMAMLRGEVKPVMRIRRLPMLGHNLGMSTWASDPEAQRRLPFARIIDEVVKMEEGEKKIVDISVFIGFAYADIPECVTTALAITDGDAALAQEIADKVASRVWDARSEFLGLRPLVPVDEAVDRAMRSDKGPVILVDVADNSGGGAPCDNSIILEALLRKGADDAVVPIRDPAAVEKAFSAYPGSTVELNLGGGIDNRFYGPVRVTAKVKALTDGEYVIRGPHHGGHSVISGVLPREAWGRGNAGRTALLKTEGIEIIVSEGRVGMERDYYKAAGVDPAERKIVVVKSAQAHRASFEGITRSIIEVDTPGCTSASYRGLTFKNIPRPVWPLDPL